MNKQVDELRTEREEADAAAGESSGGRFRYRIWFGKGGALRFISHLDLARVWERVIRRAGLPLMYSQGFNPRPRIQLASGLPLGYASTCEVLDVWLEAEPPPPDVMVARLRAASPDGLDVQRIEAVNLGLPALQTLTRAATYQVLFANRVGSEALRKAVSDLLGQAEVWRVRREKRYDLRELIDSLEVTSTDPPELTMTLRMDAERGTGRADEVVEALGLDPHSTRITRTAIHFAEE